MNVYFIIGCRRQREKNLTAKIFNFPKSKQAIKKEKKKKTRKQAKDQKKVAIYMTEG